ncbi:hypothetical protein [Plasmodium yoelii yoelii]|uniref:60S ribosomal protein L7-2 n=1 Tax=Plasmodium yoelii yoelii TaxID=73239 RepID=Q7RJF8_PLAYO|nr:hypothetical protein [Plasmodium yoelii yoelii]
MHKAKQNKKAINNKFGNQKKKHVKFKRVKKVKFKGEKKILIQKPEKDQTPQKELNLQEQFKGVLLVNTKENMEKLFLVKPYVCYGYLKKYNCYNLLEKKLYLKDNEEIKRCDSNKIIEKLFGNEGINSFPLFCEYIFECKNNADIIMKKYIIPFDFSFLKKSTTFDFLQFKNELVGFMKDEINDVLEKII